MFLFVSSTLLDSAESSSVLSDLRDWWAGARRTAPCQDTDTRRDGVLAKHSAERFIPETETTGAANGAADDETLGFKTQGKRLLLSTTEPLIDLLCASGADGGFISFRLSCLSLRYHVTQ